MIIDISFHMTTNDKIYILGNNFLCSKVITAYDRKVHLCIDTLYIRLTYNFCFYNKDSDTLIYQYQTVLQLIPIRKS